MRASCGIYPALGRYFKTLDELSRAGCMCRQRMTDCLHGRKEFTADEKQAICNAIIVKIVTGEIENMDMRTVLEARKDFDGTFRATTAVTAA